MKKNKIWLYLFSAPLILCFAVFLLVPVMIVIGTSFFEWKGFSGNITFIGFDNYIAALSDPEFIVSFQHTIIWILLQSTIHVVIGVSFAIIISRKFKGWKVLRTAFVIPNMISASALGFIFLMVFNGQIGLLNSLLKFLHLEEWARNWFFDPNTAFVSVTLTWLIFAGLIMLLVLTEIGTIPHSLYEAADLDGASQWQKDLYVTIPQLRNVIGTCMIIAATSKLKEFELIYLTTKGGPGTETMSLPLYLYNTSIVQNNFGYANMIGTILIGLGLILIYIISKVFKIAGNE
ncbi:carbohydrate ABC transporter permease [Sinanaerobacter chloroacetimidivorans]|uniref:Sugar ABC transporter permease n=1 Tax=Sinanaerobacter chloroacetimidivorans TaxID=2818044 RepID=A0A8J7VXH5_9FIRM|nr:sugar ABC transporter permease [Sinanaerobacter chloroacetimidivorans]MBR0596511.1 sugar ABC transporter permease [Sinanaerobacter chloroacetimidivorans]